MNEVYKKSSSGNKHRGAKKLMGPALMIILSFILLGIGVKFVIEKISTDELKGVWSSDQVTSYQFDGKGRGTLILPHSHYDFTYRFEEGALSIDYESDKALDAVYTVEIDGNALLLSQEEEGKESVHIKMQKQK